MLSKMEENKKKGYISLYRSLQEHFLYPKMRKFTDFEAWIDLLFHANHKENKITIGHNLIIISKGSFITSESNLSVRWQWSRAFIRSFLKLLENDNMILKEPTKKYTKITICNFEGYQNIKTIEKPQENHKKTIEKPQENIDNKDNNVNKEIINNIPEVKTSDTENLKLEEKEKPLNQKCIDLYIEFYKKIANTSLEPKLIKKDFVALADILNYFKNSAIKHNEKDIDNFVIRGHRYIFDNWHLLTDNYLKDKCFTAPMLNSKFSDIYANLKKATK